MKRLTWRPTARSDAAEAAAWYTDNANLQTGERFLESVESALAHLCRHPATGSARYSVPLQLDGLRVWPVKDFPYLIFYVAHDTHVDIWRILHAQRDIPAWMGPAE